MAKFQIRDTRMGDMEALNALYRRITGIDRSAAQFHWEWINGPYGPAPSWVIVETLTDRIVGHHGVIPVPLWVGGRPVQAARTENTMINPDFRGKFMYHAYEAKLLRELHERGFELVFTTSGKGPWGAVRRRLGYVSAGRWRTFVVFTDLGHKARRAFGGAGRLVDAFPSLKHTVGPHGWTVESTKDCAAIAALWQDARPDAGIFPQRDSAYLEWRLQNHPYNPHALALLCRGGAPVGYVAWREQSLRGGAQDILIEDIFIHGAEEEMYLAALQTLVAEWSGRGVRLLLRTLDTDTPLTRAILGAGQPTEPTASSLDSAELLVSGEPSLTGMSWHMTQLIAQGI